MATATAMEMKKLGPTSFLVLVAVLLALVLSSCYASSTNAPAPGPMMSELMTMLTRLDDPKCEVMAPCNRVTCCAYCQGIGLTNNAFCTAKPDLQIYCCCIIVAPPATATTSSSSLQAVSSTGSNILHPQVIKC